MAKDWEVLHNVTTERNYNNTRLIKMKGRIFKFHHELTNGTNAFTIELFDGDKFNYITNKIGLGIEVGPNYDVSYVSCLAEKEKSTEYVVAKGIKFIKLLV